MALHWNWNEKVGKAVDTRGYLYHLYVGNAFLIGLSEWEKNGESYWNMGFFFVSKDHCKKCLGLTKGYEREGYMENWEFTLNISVPECKEFVKLLARAGINCKIDLYVP